MISSPPALINLKNKLALVYTISEHNEMYSTRVDPGNWADLRHGFI